MIVSNSTCIKCGQELSKQDFEILAKKVGRKPFTLYRIGRGIIQPSAKLAVEIETHTGGLIRKEDLRPDIFK